MIVEDESIIRTGLTDTIDWASLGFHVVAVAHNGDDGLKKFKEARPNVVLTDIRMPKMDGLTMAKRIKALSTETQIVLLSGYDEFSYARQGIEIGVFSYILKLNMFDDIKRVFTDLRVELDRTTKDKRYYSSLEHYKIRGRVEAVLKGQGEGKLNYLDKMVVMAGYLKDTSPASIYCAKEDFLCAYTVRGTMFTALVGAKGLDEKQFADRLSELTRKMRPSFKKERVAISAVVSSEQAIKKAAASAYKILDIARANEDRLPAILYCDRELGNWLTRSPQLSFEDIVRPLPLMRYDHFLSCCVQWFDQAVRARDIDMDVARTMANRILLELCDTMDDTGIKRPEFAGDIDAELKDSLSIIDMGRILIDGCKPILKALEKTNFHQAGAAIDEAVRYVDRNFDQALSIEDVASRVHLSVPYFSSCFKKLTGMNYSVYLREKRMEQACQLLTDTSLKVYDIAHRVGYSDEKHFSKMFSKFMGVSPNKYRKEMNSKKAHQTP